MAHRHVLAYFICAFGLGESTKYALKGTQVNIIPTIPWKPQEILWKYNGNKAVEFNGNEQTVYPPFKNRVALDWVTAELNITQLRYEDSGDYELEIYLNKGFDRSNYRLEVIGKVAKPTISCEMIDGSSSNKFGIQAKLTCSAESSHPQLMRFEWSSHGNVQPGPNLTISVRDEHDDEVHSCNVGNPLTNEKATFTAKDCYPEKSSSVGLIVGLVILFAIISVVLFLGYMFRRKLVKACCTKGKRDDLEKQSPPGTKEGSNQKIRQDEEKLPLFDREPTLPSNQRLRSLARKQEIEELQQQGNVKKNKNLFEPNSVGQNFPKVPADTLKGKNADEQKPVRHASKEEDADAENEIPPCDSSHPEEANTPDPAGVLNELSEDTQCGVQSSTAPEQTESEKEADEDEEASAPASGVPPPPPQLQSPSPPSSPHMAPEGITVELNEDANSEEMNKAENQSIATSQQPQSATLTTPDNSNTNTFQESPDTAQADPEQEGMTIRDSDESEGQPDSSTAEEDKGEGQSDEEKKEVQCGPKEERPGNMSLNEDKEE